MFQIFNQKFKRRGNQIDQIKLKVVRNFVSLV